MCVVRLLAIAIELIATTLGDDITPILPYLSSLFKVTLNLRAFEKQDQMIVVAFEVTVFQLPYIANQVIEYGIVAFV
jgi:hypothetical protein